MIEVKQATPEDVFFVMMRARKRDVEEIMAVTYFQKQIDLATEYAQRYGDFPGAWCYTLNGLPVCIVITYSSHPGVWSIGMFATENLKKIGKFVTESVIRHLFVGMINAGMHRLECKSVVGYDSVHKWLLWQGFKKESICRGYGRNGEDFITFAWTKGDPLPRLFPRSAA